MNKQLIVITLLFCLASLMVIQAARAQPTLLPGVVPGEEFTYLTSSYWTSANAYTSIPQDALSANQTQSIEVIISDANDTYITTFTATYYYSGMPSAYRGSVDIQTGGTVGSPWPAVIAANLTAGDLIHPLGSDEITINQTLTMNGRVTNQIYFNIYNATNGITTSVNRYFDQQTGMLVKEVDSSVDDGSVSGYTSTDAESTTLEYSPWNPAPLPTATPKPNVTSNPTANPGWIYAVVVAVVVVVVIGALLLLRKQQNSGRRKRRENVRFKPPPPPPPPPPPR